MHAKASCQSISQKLYHPGKAEMIVFEILESILKLGIPVGFLSWYLIHRFYKSGKIPKDVNLKTVKADLASIKKNFDKKDQSVHFAERRWMKFGGGFYGVTALVTFVLIELADGLSFVANFPGFGELFKDGLISFVINFLINQLQNFISAFIWFVYWGRDGNSTIVWVVVPYLSYLAGLNLAGKSRDELKLSWDKLVAKRKRQPASETEED